MRCDQRGAGNAAPTTQPRTRAVRSPDCRVCRVRRPRRSVCNHTMPDQDFVMSDHPSPRNSPTTLARLAAAGALLAGAAVAMGAFGAHALRDSLAPEQLALWQTAVQYQFWHALALLLLPAITHWAKAHGNGVNSSPIGAIRIGLALALGVLLFSGSLYALALGAPRWLGMLTPVGGLLWLLAWVALARQLWPGRASK